MTWRRCSPLWPSVAPFAHGTGRCRSFDEFFRGRNESGRLDGVDPTVRMKKIHPSRERERTLTKDEISRLWADLDKLASIGGALRLSLTTGVRIAEAAGARRDEFNLETRVWTIPGSDGHGRRTKNGREHRVHLSALARTIVKKAMARSSGPWLFPSPRHHGRPVSPRSASRAVLRLQRHHWDQDQDRFTAHDLRRTVSTGMSDLGVPDDVIDKVLGHLLQGVRRHYNHSDRWPEQVVALDEWAEWLQRIVGVTAGQEGGRASMR
jgi:integrase